MDRSLRTGAQALVVPALLSLALTACGTGGAQTVGTTEEPGEAADLQLVASFYPLEYLLERVAGEHAHVETLTAPGIDPHDVELSPRTVGSLTSADLVVYLSGMQPAVDDAVAQQAADHALDVAPEADLLAYGESADEHAEHTDEEAEHADEHTEHTDEEAGHGDDEAEHDDHGHGAEDPHFWLDPQRYGSVATALATELARLDPENAGDYEAGAAALVADLEELDAAYTAGLASCESRDVVTTHDAFGYLGARYDLHVTGITGISPESEPSPARLAEVSAEVAELGVTTIYAEPLLSPAIAQTVANETGAQVLTLDPADGLTEASAGSDYLGIMKANLETLRQGQGCS